MSVLIKGMKMPQNCLLCPFGDEFGKCCVNAELEDANELTHSCPLVELPDHPAEGEIDKWWERNETVNVMAKLRAYESGKRSANRSMERSEDGET